MWLVTSPRGGGKTTTLLRACLGLAQAATRDDGVGAVNGGGVLFVCMRARLDADPPEASVAAWRRGGGGEIDDVFEGDLGSGWQSPYRRVKVRYVDGPEDLKRILSCLHLLPPTARPTSIVIDDLDAILDAGAMESDRSRRSAASNEARAMKCLAYLANASELTRDGAGASISVPSDGTADGATHRLYLYRRWFQTVCHLDEGGGNASTFSGSGAGGLGERRLRALIA